MEASNPTHNLLNELNESQRAAVEYIDGPQLVIAGAGSGKTRVLTYKVAYLVERGLHPFRILALTFTNKAAREMKQRIAKTVGDERARHLWMGTFHSLFLRILRTEHEAIGFSSRFTIYDTADSKSLIRSIIKEMQLDEKVYKPSSVQSRISNAKNHLIAPPAYANDRQLYEDDCARKMPAIRDIYRRYWERLRQSDAMDFDDLLFQTYLLFQQNPQILSSYQQQFAYILVDEYQDTNFAQHCIVRQLAAQHQRVCVVGDDAQSIYSFRGANIDNILTFANSFPSAKLFKLEQNYRSTQTIVGAANSLISKNRRQIEKNVVSMNAEGEKIALIQAYSDIEEGEIVGNKIRNLCSCCNASYADFAILYRTNAQSRIFEEVLRKKGIPYRIYGGLSFYQRKEIKDVIAYFRLVVNPHDEEALKRIINYPARGIGETTLKKVIGAAAEFGVSLWQVLCEPLSFGVNVNSGTLGKLQKFRSLMEEPMQREASSDAYELGLEILKKSGIAEVYATTKEVEEIDQRENIEELMNGINLFVEQRREEGNEHVSLSDYLSEISLITDQDMEKGDDTEFVTLMTIHAAKGLEFKSVFVVGMEENLFPGAQSAESAQQLEEERRLFYVALTRAEERCFLSYSKSRMHYGKMDYSAPSRFLKDINPQYLHIPQTMFTNNPVSRSENRINQESTPIFKTFEKPNRSFGSSQQSFEQPNRNFSPNLGLKTDRPISSSHPTTIQPNFRKVQPTSPADQSNFRRVQSASPSENRPNPVPTLSIGSLIEHDRFGIGQVLQLEGTGDNAKATIQFKNAGVKQLLLRFARFKLITP
ncbi:MAG: UvrD-helicase domain-containing protein [Bacteroides sp.]|nr:UvrD-helicase domain-containing protein [Bacteroides sp.]